MKQCLRQWLMATFLVFLAMDSSARTRKSCDLLQGVLQKAVDDYAWTHAIPAGQPVRLDSLGLELQYYQCPAKGVYPLIWTAFDTSLEAHCSLSEQQHAAYFHRLDLAREKKHSTGRWILLSVYGLTFLSAMVMRVKTPRPVLVRGSFESKFVFLSVAVPLSGIFGPTLFQLMGFYLLGGALFMGLLFSFFSFWAEKHWLNPVLTMVINAFLGWGFWEIAGAFL